MKRILVCTDLSPCANNAVRYAIQLAKQGGFSLEFFYSAGKVKNASGFISRWPDRYKAFMLEAEEKLRNNILAQYKKLKVPVGSFSLKVGLGSFLANLFEISILEKAGLLVIGTHGASGIQERIFGGHSQRVIAASPVPVLAIPCGKTWSKVDTLTYFSDLRHPAAELKRAGAFARQLGAKLALVHFDYGWAKTPGEARLMKKLAQNHVFTNIRVSIDEPFLALLKKYHRNKHSLACFFHDKKTRIEKILTGSNPEEAVVKYHAPLLSFQR